MKLMIEYAANYEPLITVKGDPSDPRIRELISVVERLENGTGSASDKVELFRDEELFFIDTGQILYFEASDDRVAAHTAEGEYRSRQRLYQLEERFGKTSFVQINKGILLNVEAVRSVQAEFSGNYLVSLKGLPEKLVISRRYFKSFKEAVLKQKRG